MLTGKIIVITGGAGLLGRSFCNMVAENGGNVVVADVDVERAINVAEEINLKFAGAAQALSMNITDKDSVCAVITKLFEQYGHVDAVVNNAYPRNSNYGRSLENVTYEDFCENSGLHLGGYFLVAQQFSHFFCGQGYGNIINMSSIYGVMTPRFDVYSGTTMTMPVEYAAIKSAVVQLTRYFAQFYKTKGVRVNCISPGGIFDNQPEPFINAYKAYAGNKGMLSPDDICGTLLFLLSDLSKYITGQNIVVDDGFSL